MKITKTCSIGDIHGRDTWMNFTHGSPANFAEWKKSIENNTEYTKDALYDTFDKIIFVGDYVDSFDVSNGDMTTNLENIILFKKTYPDKVVLLIGNHDLQYIVSDQRCSGYRPVMRQIFNDLFHQNRDLFQLAFSLKNTIWTHAGITEGWLDEFHQIISKPDGRFYEVYKEIEDASIEEKLNTAWKHKLSALFTVDSESGGISKWAGPLWVRPNTLNAFALPSFFQIVGHTHQDTILETKNVAYIDVLGSANPTAYYLDI